MSNTKTLPQISSFAAPTEAELAILRSLSDEDRQRLIADHIAQGERDIAEARYTELSSREDIKKFFDAKRAKYADSAL